MTAREGLVPGGGGGEGSRPAAEGQGRGVVTEGSLGTRPDSRPRAAMISFPVPEVVQGLSHFLYCG